MRTCLFGIFISMILANQTPMAGGLIAAASAGAADTVRTLTDSLPPSYRTAATGKKFGVITVNGDLYNGKLIMISADSLVLSRKQGKPIAIARSNVDSVVLYKRGEPGPMMLGTLLGVGLGTAIYAVISTKQASSPENLSLYSARTSHPWKDNLWMIPFSAILGALCGAASETAYKKVSQDEYWRPDPVISVQGTPPSRLVVNLTIHF